jgi:GntP family gluconate:H+ symporter
MSADSQLLWIAAAGVGVLVVLVAVCRLHAFLALALVSLGVGVGAGLKPLEAAKAFQDGVGGTLGLIAVVVGLGTMLGKLLSESGGATVIAEVLVRRLGERRLDWSILVAAFVVGLPVFFGVGLVLLVPVVFTLAAAARVPMVRLMLPLLAALSISHCLVPPHPGPVVAVGRLGADMGRSILWAMVVGFPTAALVGPVLAGWLSRRMVIVPGGLGAQLKPSSRAPRPPGFGVAVGTILVPVVLMLVSSVADVALAKEHPGRVLAAFVGSPLVAMLVAVLVALWTFGLRCGYGGRELLKFTEDCAAPAAGIFLIVGAGGGFSKVLDLAGVDDAIAAAGRGWALSPILLGWVVAALLRAAVGSATVSITMTAAIVAPLAAADPTVNRELLVVALGAGTLAFSHLNDGGFWMVKEYFGLSVGETFRTWGLMVTLASGIALGLVLVLDWLLRLA